MEHMESSRVGAVQLPLKRAVLSSAFTFEIHHPLLSFQELIAYTLTVKPHAVKTK